MSRYLVLAICLFAGTPASAEVRLAEVQAPSRADLTGPLRDDVERQLGAMKIPHIRALVLSVSLTRMESRDRAAACAVSVVMRDRRGVILGALTGNARVETDSSRARAERVAMSAAVRSALARLPDVMAQTPAE
jgi:hypothetical protein